MQTITIKTEQPRETRTFIRRIGTTNYRVNVHFSKTSSETMNDKVIRLIRNETASEAV